uniref:Uncharacterized protein n=1 Tax=Eiseniibacteriota bacterium TaxID=2212470 RepID=A0A832ML47_UNCEI
MRSTLPTRFAPAPVLAGLLCGAALVLGAADARAQLLRPWTPPAADTLQRLAADARVAFRANRGDSATGPNFTGYDLSSRIARRLVRSLGRHNLLQAPAIEAVMDSLGLDTDVAIDAALPNFVLVMVRNPFLRPAHAVGFLYWYRGAELLQQGVVFRGGLDPVMRVWFTGRPSAPYLWAVLDGVRDEPNTRRFTLLELGASGGAWNAVQYEGAGPDFGPVHEVTFADVNRDGVPEMVAWGPSPADSLFEFCPACPGLIAEQTWVLRGNRFGLEESRLVPSALANFTLFIRMLREGNRAGAARLLEDPALVDEAIGLGWGKGAGRGLWNVEMVENESPWPRFIQVRFGGAPGRPLYNVHFGQKDGRWVIRRWGVPRRGGTPEQQVTPGAPEPARPRR